MNPLIVSGYFGDHIRNVYPAIRGYRCIFFSNNPTFKQLITSRGWEFRLAQGHPVTSDYRLASIQSKYVKFLRFRSEFPEFRDAAHIIYFDHTVFARRSDIRAIEKLHDHQKSVLILSHIATDRSIGIEVDEASKQPRYAEKMAETVEWIEDLKRSHGITEDAKVDATTIISYRNPDEIMSLVNMVYTAIVDLGQPECQIIWSCLAQLYPDQVKRVPWNAIDPRWRVQYVRRRDRVKQFIRRSLSLVKSRSGHRISDRPGDSPSGE